MGFSYIKSKLTTCNAFGSSFSSNIASHNAILSSSSRFSPTTLMVTTNFTRFAVAPFMCLVGLKHMHTSAYVLMSRGILKNTKTSMNWSVTLRQCMRSCRNNWLKLVLGGGILISVCFLRIERIPYSRRFHVALTEGVEEFLGEHQWNDFKKEHQGKILRLSDGKSKRVESVAKNIIRAMNSGLGLEHECKINGKLRVSEGILEPISSDNHGEILCEEEGLKKKNIRQNWHRKLIWKPKTKHLKRENWEIYVVDTYEINAACLLGGRIVIYKGLLNKLDSDEEIATVIGHEIGHAVARHIAEGLGRGIWILILMVCLIFSSKHSHTTSGIGRLFELLQNYISRRREAEADYIGLMLMASAGYNPRVASRVYEKRIGGEGGIYSTHPSGSKRAKLLKKPKVMEEALAVYEEVRAGYKVRSFI